MNLRTENWLGREIRFIEVQKSFKSGNSRRIRKQAYLDWIEQLEEVSV